MDPWGSTWHATILTPHRGEDSTGEISCPPDFTHAYMPHRSWEAPIAVMEITTERLKAAGISHVRSQYDAKHVFPSLGRESLLKHVPRLAARAADVVASQLSLIHI